MIYLDLWAVSCCVTKLICIIACVIVVYVLFVLNLLELCKLNLVWLIFNIYMIYIDGYFLSLFVASVYFGLNLYACWIFSFIYVMMSLINM